MSDHLLDSSAVRHRIAPDCYFCSSLGSPTRSSSRSPHSPSYSSPHSPLTLPHSPSLLSLPSLSLRSPLTLPSLSPHSPFALLLAPSRSRPCFLSLPLTLALALFLIPPHSAPHIQSNFYPINLSAYYIMFVNFYRSLPHSLCVNMSNCQLPCPM